MSSEEFGRLEWQKFSKEFAVRRMDKEDAQMIYDMTSKNLQFYEFCGRENFLNI